MRLLFAAIFICFLLPLFSQITQGEIIFEEKINIHKSLPPEMADFKAQIPEFRTSKKVLYFTQSETLYEEAKKTVEEQELQADMGRRRMRFRRGGGERKLYTNIDEKIVLEQSEFFGKSFLIDGAGDPIKWKMTPEQKQVGSYLCQKVTFQDTTRSIVAWFTPMIPVSAGPAEYGQLPGMILHIDINDGERMFTALEINPKELEEGTIVRPEKGDKVTREEYDKIVEEKTAEMREQFGGNRSFRFQRRN
jgi:GLPGLI family protein